MLRGIGVAVAGSLAVVAGCGGSGSNPGVDGGVKPVDGGAGACPTGDLCLDITKAPYTALKTVGNSVLVNTSAGQLIVVRSSATAVEALASACTHQGVTVSYDSGAMQLVCFAHGATFALSGAVTGSPANRPLKSYVTTLAGNIITIKLV
jgi:cytochrome b6-f complex iron-sulfur subunit